VCAAIALAAAALAAIFLPRQAEARTESAGSAESASGAVDASIAGAAGAE